MNMRVHHWFVLLGVLTAIVSLLLCSGAISIYIRAYPFNRALGARGDLWCLGAALLAASALLLGLIAARQARRRCQNRIRTLALCHNCGYSMIGLGSSDRCPECGSLHDPVE